MFEPNLVGGERMGSMLDRGLDHFACETLLFGPRGRDWWLPDHGHDHSRCTEPNERPGVFVHDALRSDRFSSEHPSVTGD